jgi:hypothetical protein
MVRWLSHIYHFSTGRMWDQVYDVKGMLCRMEQTQWKSL